MISNNSRRNLPHVVLTTVKHRERGGILFRHIRRLCSPLQSCDRQDSIMFISGGAVLDSWSAALYPCITPIQKKGDLCPIRNYREISLTPITANIYNHILLNRIIPHTCAILRTNQEGFRK